MKVKLISDGTRAGTKIINIETGEMLEGAILTKWSIGAGDDYDGVLHILMKNVPVEIVGEANIEVPKWSENDRLLNGELPKRKRRKVAKPQVEQTPRTL